MSITTDELGACYSIYILLMFNAVFDTIALLFMLWLFIMIVDEVMEYLLNKRH